MPNLICDARQVLSDAEERLRTLMQAALESGDYDQIPALAHWAKGVARVRQESTSVPTPPDSVPVNTGSAAVSSEVLPKSRRTGRRRPRRKTSSRRINRQYPRFARSGQRLAKISWSKARGSEYVHFAPKPVTTSLLESLLRKDAGIRPVSVEDVLPLTSEGSEVPSYQVYLALAWLRVSGILRQHGRQGYSVAREDSRTAVERGWEALPEYE